MAKQTIAVGTVANDGTGDQLRAAFIKTNDNTDEIYGGTASVVRQTEPDTATGPLEGVSGDIAGMIATDGVDVWVCRLTWTAPGQAVWIKIDLTQLAANTAGVAANLASIGTNDTDIATNLASVTAINAGTGTVARTPAPATAKGAVDDTIGMIAFDTGFIYVCHATYTNGTPDIWHRAAIVTW